MFSNLYQTMLVPFGYHEQFDHWSYFKAIIMDIRVEKASSRLTNHRLIMDVLVKRLAVVPRKDLHEKKVGSHQTSKTYFSI